MLDYEEIEERAYDDFLDSYECEDEYLEGDLDVQYDVDEFYPEAFSCTLYAEDIVEWIADNFDRYYTKYLKDNHVKELSQLALDADLQDEELYYEFCQRTYHNIVNQLMNECFDEFCDEYLQEHGERDYD